MLTLLPKLLPHIWIWESPVWEDFPNFLVLCNRIRNNRKKDSWKWCENIFQSHVHIARHEFVHILELILGVGVADLARGEGAGESLGEGDATGGGGHREHLPLLHHLLLCQFQHLHLLPWHVSWSPDRRMEWNLGVPQPAQLLGLVDSSLLENKGRKVESNTGWEKSKAGKQNKDRDWGGKAKAVGRWSQYHSFALLCYVFLASNVFFSHLASVGTMLSWTEWSLSSILPK